MTPWEDLAEHWRDLSDIQVYDTMTEQLDVPCLVLLPDDPWIENGAANGYSSQTDSERYLAYAIASSSTASAAQRQLHIWAHFIINNLPGGWDWEATGSPAQREHQGITYMAVESRLKFNACTAGDPYEGDSSS